MQSQQFINTLNEESAIALQKMISKRLKEIYTEKNKAIRFSGTFADGDTVQFTAKKVVRSGIFKRWLNRNASVEANDANGTKQLYSIQPRKITKVVITPPPVKVESNPTPKSKKPIPVPVPIETLFPELHLQATKVTTPTVTPTQLAQIQKNREEALKKKTQVRFTTASLKLKEQERVALENEKRQRLKMNPIPRQETTQVGNKMIITTTSNEIDIETGKTTRTNVKSTVAIDLIMLDD